MSVKVKGGMYCPRCHKPVMAQRSGHAVRNTIGAAATLGLALKTEQWRCPDCGGVQSALLPESWNGRARRRGERRSS